jgi:hypothetical protein
VSISQAEKCAAHLVIALNATACSLEEPGGERGQHSHNRGQQRLVKHSTKVTEQGIKSASLVHEWLRDIWTRSDEWREHVLFCAGPEPSQTQRCYGISMRDLFGRVHCPFATEHSLGAGMPANPR